LKPLKKSRNKNLRVSRLDLDSKGLKGVASTLIQPDTQGLGKLGIGKLLPLRIDQQAYEPVLSRKGDPIISNNTVKKFSYLFVKYENSYIPGGDEILYSFAVVIPLQPMTVNDCASQLGVKATNVTGLTEAQYTSGTFQHPVYINQNKQLLTFRYAEIATIPQTTPGRLDNVPLGYPDFNYNPSPITTQKGILPQPPYPDFETNKGNTGATAIAVGGTVGFLDKSLRTPSIVRPSAWNWDFGGTGATPTGSTAQNPTVTFGAAGTYTVTLTASNSNGSATVTKTNFVTVS
jgi:hypothetical protein